MNKMRRLLALMLCMLLTLSPIECVLSESDFIDDDIVIAETFAPETMPVPTEEPVEATAEPIPEPTQESTVVPAVEATPEAEIEPTVEPTLVPEVQPSVEPTVEATVEPTLEATEEPASEPTVEPTLEPELEASVEPTVEPSVEPSIEPSVEPTVEPEVEAAFDYTRSAVENPGFTKGYAALLTAAVGYASEYPQAEPLYNLDGGVFYVSNRIAVDGCDRLEVFFACEGEELSAWVDADFLRPMAEEEVQAFISERIASVETCYLGGDLNLPLDMPAVGLAASVSLFSIPEDVPVMSVEPASLTLGVSESRELLVSYSDGQSYPLSFVSENAEIASVSENGTVTGKKRGSTKVHVSDELGNLLTLEVVVEKAPTSIKIPLARTMLGLGEKMILPIQLSDGAVSHIQYTIDQPEVLAIDSVTGEMTALAAGQATVTAKTYNNKSVACTITVVAAPESISIDNPVEILGAGQEYTLKVSLNEGSAGAYSFESDKPEIVSVDAATGVLVANEPGMATIRVSTYNEKEIFMPVEVKPAPSCVNFAVTEVKVGVGEQILIPDVVLGAENEDCAGAYSFKSSSTKYVSITADGKIKGNRVGSAKVNVTTHNGMTGTLTVRVYNAPKSVSISPKTDTLGVGEVLQLKHSLPTNTMSAVNYSSSAPEIAEVNAVTGEVIARAAGQAVITVSTFNNKKANSTITVVPAPEGISIDNPVEALGVGQEYALKVSLNEGSAGGYRIESDKPEIVSVDAASGKLTACAVGSATIRVVAYNEVDTFLTMEVKPAPSCVSFAADEVYVGVGECLPMPGITMGTEGEDCAGTYSLKSSSTKYMSVTSDGQIKGNRAGTATLTVTTHNGMKDTLKVRIYNAPKSVSISPKTNTLGVGEVLQMKHGLPKNTMSAVSYSSNAPEIAEVNAVTGEVIAKAVGQAVITVSTFNNKKANSTITVVSAPESIAIDNPVAVLGVEQKYTLKASLNEGSAGGYSFESDKPEIVSVDAASGELTAHAIGSATIRVVAYNGVDTFMTMEIKPAPSCVSFTVDEVRVGVGERLPMPGITLGAEGEDCAGSYSLKSSSTKYMSVTSDGQIKGNRAGTTTLTVTTHNGMMDTLTVRVYNAPKSVSISPKTDTLGVGEVLQLKHSLPKNTMSVVGYSSNAPEIAEVNPITGEVIAKAAGQAVITVSTFNNKKANSTITVVPAPESIAINNPVAVLGVEQKYTLKASLNEGSAGGYRFESDKPEIVSVDAASGELTAHAIGSATIRVVAYNGVDTFLTMEVKPAPSCVSFAADEVCVGVGEYLPMPGITLGTEGEDCAGSYSLKSSSTKYLSVTSDGQIKGNRAGTVTLTVTTHNGMKDTLKVRIYSAPKSVSISPKTDTLGVGEVLQLQHSLPKNTMSAVSYSSNAPEIAEVNPITGEVIAKAAGQAVITVKTFNNKRANCTLTIMEAPQQAFLDRGALILGVKESYALKAGVPAGSSSKFNFTSSDAAIATVDQSTGKVVGVAPGTAVITVSTYNGCEAKCEVIVKAEPMAVALQETSLVLSVGDSYQLKEPVLSGEDAGCSKYSYSTSSSKYVSVNADGLIKGVRAGSATITVKTYNGKKDTLKVTVKAAPKSIAFEKADMTILMCDVLTPTVTFDNKSAGNYTLSSGNPQVAVISEDGRSILPVASGIAEITATSYNGKIAKMNLTVLGAPESVNLQPAAFVLGAGDSRTLQATMPAGQGSSLRYFSSDTNVATVDEQGKVTAVAPGYAEIMVETFNGKTCSSLITVMAAPSRVQLTPRSAGRSIDEGSIQLQMNFGSDQEGGRYSYSSSDSSIATVSADGLVSFVSTGTVQIRVTTYNGRVGVCDLTIGETPSQISFSQSVYKVALGDNIGIPASFDKGCESYSFSVDNGDIAAASGDRVVGLSVGSTNLTVTSRSGLTASCILEVVPAPTGITLEQQEVELKVGVNPTVQLNASAEPDGVGSVYFISSNPDVAVVDYYTGLVEGKDDGECVITAFTYDGKQSAQCKVTVRSLLYGVKIGIDPGHQKNQNLEKESSSPKGGSSKAKVSSGTGGCATKILEHVTNLNVALKLRDALESLGAEVYLTRETADVNISNKQRALMMNELGVDLVLRLHCNSADSSGISGLDMYVRKTCAYSNTVVDGKQLLANEKQLVSCLFSEFKNATGCKTRSIRYSDEFTGNNWSTVPCVLVEMGFSSNPTEDRLLNDPDYQDKMVKGMINGICKYKGLELPY